MTERVVEALEVIEIEHEDCKRCLVAGASMDFALQGFFEISPIEEAGQRIPNRLSTQRFAQPQISRRARDLLGNAHAECQMRVIDGRVRGLLPQMKHADGVVECNHWNTNIRRS